MFVTRIRKENQKTSMTPLKTPLKFFFSILALIIFSMSVTQSQTVNAKPLPKKECKALQIKLKTLKTTPAVMNMSKGFEWVKANMKGDELLPIKEFIETEEQYKFRCPQPRKKKAPKPKPKTANADAKKAVVDNNKKTNVKKPVKKKADKAKKKTQPKKTTTKKKPLPKKKTTKKKSSLEEKPKTEPTLFETIFPSSVEYNNKNKS